MKNVITIAALIALLLLSACGGQATPIENSPGSSSPNEQADTGKQQQTDGANETDDREKPGDPAEQNDGDQDQLDPENEEQQEETDTETIEVTHVMNKNYIFQPIDPDGNKKVVLLTFDDGPKEAEMIVSMLDILEKHHAKAIFFVNGYRVKANPDLLVKLYEHGHVIGNHSWDHVELPKQTEEEIDRQISDVQTFVEELIGEAPKFFRPPHGAGNDYIRAKVQEHGMLYMTWSNGSLDWEKGYQTAESVVEQVLKQLHPGSNILMHELPWTVEALDTLLTKLEEEGYSFLDPRAIQLPAEISTADRQLSSPNE